ncbi:MAG: hypothetical protein ACFFAS_16075 [Promethearchaeota archaeon]
MERKVKGTLVKSIVKGIKSDKTNKQKYDDFLTDKAKELLNIRILDSLWYSFDMYLELYLALGKFYAKNNNAIFLKWGRQFGEGIMTSIYRHIIGEGNVDKLIEKYRRLYKLFFNFGNYSLERISNNEIIVGYKDFEPNYEFWYYTAVGWIQKSVEMCIEKKVNYEFLKKSWKGDEFTEFKFTWLS